MSKQQTKVPAASPGSTEAGIDCMELKRAAGERIYETTKDMSPEEEAAYWAGVEAEMRKAFAARRSPESS